VRPNLDDAVSIDSHDPVQQTHKVMQNMRQLIEEAGGKMEHLVKIVVYITDIRHREAVYRTMGEYIKGVHPGFNGPRGPGAGPTRVAGRNRRHGRHSGLNAGADLGANGK
jgi:Putative translation initiation inhibitor, yjgF family